LKLEENYYDFTKNLYTEDKNKFNKAKNELLLVKQVTENKIKILTETTEKDRN